MLKLLKEKLSDNEMDESSGVVTFLNPYSYLLLRQHKWILSRVDRVYIDGQWLCNFLKWFDIASPTRISFDNSSIAPEVFSKAEINNTKIALVGSGEDVAVKFCEYVKNAYPDIDIQLSRNGFFKNESDIDKCHDEIIKKNIKLVIVGMGAIKQDEFLLKLKDKGWDGLGYTCGGFMHQTVAKGHEYYPKWINKYNLRFLYRMWDEPKLIRRYLVDYPKFVLVFFVDVIFKSFKKSKL